MTDWEKRARELVGHTKEALEQFECDLVEPMLQLGREMADARAEEIAQSIADGRCASHEPDDYGGTCAFCNLRRAHALIARGTTYRPTYVGAGGQVWYTSHRADPKDWDVKPVSATEIAQPEPACDDGEAFEEMVCVSNDAAIRADERERCAAHLEAAARGFRNVRFVHGWSQAAEELRENLPLKPKIREQVLEEALREMVARYEKPREPVTNNFVISDCLEIARRALDWKPA